MSRGRARVGLLVGLVAFGAAARSVGAEEGWALRRSARPAASLAPRYRALLERDPDDQAALRRLLALTPGGETALRDRLRAEAARPGASAATQLLLGHLLRRTGDDAGAAAAYVTAAAAAPRASALGAAARRAAGELARARGDREGARAAFSEALAATAGARARRPLLRALGELLLEARDGAAVPALFDELAAGGPGEDLPLLLDLADALAAAGEGGAAASRLEALAGRLRADPLRRAEVLRRRGALLERGGDDPAALAAYDEAIAAAEGADWLRHEILERVIAVHRRRDELRALVARLERPGARRGPLEHEALARLHDELGEVPQAIEAYRRAIGARPAAIEIRSRLIALLERAGRPEEAVAEYQRLVAVAPGEPRFQLELAERLARRGELAGARALLERVARRFPRDPAVHAALVDLYGRWGDAPAALREAEQLARVAPEDDRNLVDLGEQYWQLGRKPKALETWRRLLDAIPKRPVAMARLADVLAEHDGIVEALELYDKALRLAPDDPPLLRGRAGVLERARRPEEAIAAWERLLALAPAPALQPLRREARARLLALLYRDGRLVTRLAAWRKRFEAAPPDLEAGALLGDALLKLGRLDEAARLLGQLLERRGEDPDALESLAQLLRRQGKLGAAVDALERLARAAPGRGQEVYAQIAELDLQLHRDEAAVVASRRAIELGPADPLVRARLAELYEKRGAYGQAMEAWEKARELDPRLFRAHFALARLHLRRGAHAEALALYRDVIARAPDEELVADAGRRAIDLAEYLGALGPLERALAPLAFTAPRPVYPRLLVTLLERYVPPVAERAARGDAEAARELARMGEHGLRPLLDVVAAGEPGQRLDAVALLGRLGNRNAVPVLLALLRPAPPAEAARAGASAHPRPPAPTSAVAPPARPPGARPGAAAGAPATASRRPAPGGALPLRAAAELELRRAAALAIGRLGDARALEPLAALAVDPDVSLREAAVWALGRLRDPRAEAPLVRALEDGQPAVQALAAAALGNQRGARSLVALVTLVGDERRTEAMRAAAAWALGARAEPVGAVALIDVLGRGNDDVQRKAAWALGRIGDRAARPALARALFTRREQVREAALAALLRLGADGAAPAGEPASPAAGGPALAPAAPEPTPTWRGGRLDLPALLAGLAVDREAPPPSAALVDACAAELVAGLADALGRHRDLQRRALADLDADASGPALGPISRAGAALPAGARLELAAAASRVAVRVGGEVEALTASADPELRRLALSVAAKLAARSPGPLPEPLVRSLGDGDPEVRAGAVAALGRLAQRSGAAREASLPLLVAALAEPRAAVRRAATRALARLGPEATTPLARASADPDGFVRAAAVEGLAALAAAGVTAARAALETAAHDEALAVRRPARAALERPAAP